jgi:hypothetical protein
MYIHTDVEFLVSRTLKLQKGELTWQDEFSRLDGINPTYAPGAARYCDLRTLTGQVLIYISPFLSFPFLSFPSLSITNLAVI